MKSKYLLLLLVAAFAVAGCASTPEQRAADEQRHEADVRRHAEENLRHKFAQFSTAELKLMDTRYKELRQSSGRDLDVTVNSPLV